MTEESVDTGTSLAAETEAAHQAAVETAQTEQAEATSWYQNIEDPDLRSYVEKTGYKSLDDVASAAKNGRQLVSKIQGDPDRVLLMPKDWDDQAQVDEFYGKLGRPESVDGYEFVDSEGNAIEGDPVVDWFKDTAFRNGLSNEKATEMLSGFQEVAAQLQEQQQQEAEESWKHSVEQDKAQLQKEWGNAYNDKLATARAALQQFPELNSAELERSIGTAAYYKLVAGIGEKVGEHSVVSGGQRNDSFGKTPQQAQQELQELQASKEWQDAFFDQSHIGHKAALAKRDALMRDAYPEG